jgi:dephospho-CoA kinase
MGKPVVIGLTGNIGTGKSTVAQILAGLGALVIDADQVAHQVMEPGQPAHGQILEAFGPAIAPGGGAIDRARLGQIVFADPGSLERLEAIVHPAVVERISTQVAQAAAPVVVVEAIKLLEAGLARQLCDVVWVVTAPRAQQIERLMAGRGLSRPEALLRINAQPPQSDKVAQADAVIDNGGSRAQLHNQVMEAWESLVGVLPEDGRKVSEEPDEITANPV